MRLVQCSTFAFAFKAAMGPIWVSISGSKLIAMLIIVFVEGPWTQVMQAIHDCHAAVHAKGAPRIATDIRIGTRVDREIAPGTGNESKVQRVEEILKRA